MGMLEDALREYAAFEDRSTNPSTPSAGEGLIYFKDGKIHSIDDAGTVVDYGAGGGGGSVEVEVARVETSQGTTSATFTDLATSGPAVTVDVPASGILVVSIGTELFNTTASNGAMMCFALSGANTLAASDDRAISTYEDLPHGGGRTSVLTGLNSGITTVTAKYRRLVGGTANFLERELSAMVGLIAE